MKREGPIIVLGMHRSGTSLVSRLLQRGGVNMGASQSVNAESLPFRKINERLLANLDANWADVTSIRGALTSNQRIEHLVGVVERRLRRSLRRHARRGRTAVDLWGFKDPRTTLFVPVWSRVFPHARWVYLLRNGLDVALSLDRRARLQRISTRRRLLPRYFYSNRLTSLDECFQLWVDYVELFESYRNAIPQGRLLDLRYEALTSEPERRLRDVFDHACVVIDEAELSKIAETISPRPRNPLRSAEVERLARHPKLAELGY